MTDDDDATFERMDRRFQEFQRMNPGVGFGRYSAELQLDSINRGGDHPTLGTNLRTKPDWRTAGKPTFDALVRRCDIKPSHFVADYGCGSLRIGTHFIEYLDPGRYFGIDVIMGFIEIALAAIDKRLITKKRPRFLDLRSLTAANTHRFSADFVCSTACVFQVHPAEQSEMFSNLDMLGRKRDSRIVFDTMIAEEHFRYRSSAWAWPIDHYIRNLPGFELMDRRISEKRLERGREVEWTWLTFRRL